MISRGILPRLFDSDPLLHPAARVNKLVHNDDGISAMVPARYPSPCRRVEVIREWEQSSASASLEAL